MAPSGKHGGEPAAKRRKVNSFVKEKCDSVASTIEFAPGLATSTRQMLIDMIRIIPRHGGLSHGECKHLGTIVGMFDEALSNIQKGIMQEIGEAEAKVNGSDEEKVARETAVAEAEKSLSQQQEVTTQRKNALAEDSRSSMQAKDLLVASKAAQEAGDAEANAAAEKKDVLKTALSDSIEPLIAGGVEHAVAMKQASALAKLLQKYNVDESMRTAIPTAFAKEPSARGTFDIMVVQQVSQVVKDSISSLDAILDNNELMKAERAAAVASAQETCDTAKDKVHESAAALRHAQDDEKEAEVTLKAKQALLKELGPEIQQSVHALDAAKVRLTTLREGGLAAWRYLSTPPPAAAVEPSCNAADQPAPEEPTAKESDVEDDAAVKSNGAVSTPWEGATTTSGDQGATEQ